MTYGSLRRSLRRSLVAGAIIPLVAAKPAVTPPITPRTTAASGLTYDFTTRVTSNDPRHPTTDQVTMQGHAALQDDKMRVDIDAMGAGGATMNGFYTLVLDGGRRFVWVDPKQKQYYESTTFNLLGGISAFMASTSSLFKMTATNVHIDANKVGAGPTILGYPTVHYRITQSMDMTVHVLMKTMKTHDESVIDSYYAPSLKNFINPFLSNLSAMMGQMTMLGDEYMQQMRAAMAKVDQSGAPLKTVAASTRTDASGNVTTSTATTEISNLKTTTIPDAQFAIPSGYTKVEPPPMPATVDMQDGKQPSDSANPEGTTDKAKKAIRGLFGRH